MILVWLESAKCVNYDDIINESMFWMISVLFRTLCITSIKKTCWLWHVIYFTFSETYVGFQCDKIIIV